MISLCAGFVRVFVRMSWWMVNDLGVHWPMARQLPSIDQRSMPVVGLSFIPSDSILFVWTPDESRSEQSAWVAYEEEGASAKAVIADGVWRTGPTRFARVWLAGISQTERTKKASRSRKKAAVAVAVAVAVAAVAVVARRVAFDIGAVSSWIVYKPQGVLAQVTGRWKKVESLGREGNDRVFASAWDDTGREAAVGWIFFVAFS
jgi:hypothetical protein